MKLKAIPAGLWHILAAIFTKRAVPLRTIIRCTAMIWAAKVQADSLFKKFGKRFYAIYCPEFKKMYVVSYDFGVKSYRYLYHRGVFTDKMMTPEQLKEKCCYYSASKSSGECKGDAFDRKLKDLSTYCALNNKK